jgi:uncharacterized protein YgbK (DUF1537 family)
VADLALIADDVTGAADSGAPFAAAGFTTAIPFDKPRREAADVLCLSTDSRDVPLAEAKRRVQQALTAVFGADGAQRPAWIYKKMDSALRGYPAEELLLTMQVARATRAVVAPAIPSQRRTTVGGIVFDQGTRLSETPIGREHGRDNLVQLLQQSARMPVRSIGLDTIRGTGRDLRDALSLSGSWIAVADAEHDTDLERLAEVAFAAGIRLFCGAAGLTNVLARHLPIHQVHRPPDIARLDRPMLVVAGSRHALTAVQIDFAREQGTVIISLEQSHLDQESPDLRSIQGQVLESLRADQPTIVTSAGLRPSRFGGEDVAERLAAAAITSENLPLIGGLVLTGGDVAAAVCRSLGVSAIWLRGEVLPAIPWATVSAARADGLPIVTKAGSFGPPEAISSAIDFLGRLRSGNG